MWEGGFGIWLSPLVWWVSHVYVWVNNFFFFFFLWQWQTVVFYIIIFNFLQLEVELNVAGNLEFAAIYNSTLYVSGFFLLSVTSR